MVIAWVSNVVALMVTLAITNLTCLMASECLLDLRAACCHHLCHAFRVLCKLFVQPRHGKCWALLFTGSVFACVMAGLDRWELLASLHEWHPRLGALGMAICILATLVVACMSLFHLLVHLLPMLAVVLIVIMMIAMVVVAVTMLVMVAMMIVMMITVLVIIIVLVMVVTKMEPRTFVVAFEVTRSASLVASMGLLDLRAHFFSLLSDALRILVELRVHPINIELWTLGTICIFARCAACLDGREV